MKKRIICAAATAAVLCSMGVSTVSAAAAGDINGDGKIDSKDATAILTDYAGVILGKPSAIDKTAADVNSDNTVDSKDASKILSYYAESILGKNVGSIISYVPPVSDNTLYAPLIIDTMSGYDAGEYIIFDLNKDGYNECIMKVGTCEADYMYKVYTRDKTTCRYVGELGAGHSSLMTYKNELYRIYAHMGIENIDKIEYKNNSLDYKSYYESPGMLEEYYIPDGFAFAPVKYEINGVVFNKYAIPSSLCADSKVYSTWELSGEYRSGSTVCSVSMYTSGDSYDDVGSISVTDSSLSLDTGTNTLYTYYYDEDSNIYVSYTDEGFMLVGFSKVNGKIYADIYIDGYSVAKLPMTRHYES